MVKLLLARHGETTWDHEKRLSGQSEVSLSSKGKEQAKILGIYIKEHYTIDMFFSSKLKRSIQTANITSKVIKKEFQQVKEFNDIDCGETTGMNRKELQENYPELLLEWEKDTDPLFQMGKI